MDGFLRQSTAATIKLGPFLDAADAVTAEDGLTISQADIRLSKNGGNIAQTNNTTGATHDELGYYDVPLDTTDTNTVGRLRVIVSESGALPVWADFMVLPANVYDALIAGSDMLDVNAAEYAGVATESTDTALATVPSNFALLEISAGGTVGINWGNVENQDATVDLSGTTVENLTNADITLGTGAITNDTFADGAIDNRVITTAAAAQAANVASGDVTARRGDTIASLAITTTAHDWDSGKSMRLILKSQTGYASENDSTDAYLGLKLTHGGAVGDGLYLLNGDTRTDAGDLDDGSLVRSSSTQTLVNVSAAAYAELEPKTYSYEIQVAESDGSSVVTIAAGEWTVTEDVVRATS